MHVWSRSEQTPVSVDAASSELAIIRGDDERYSTWEAFDLFEKEAWWY